MRLILSLVFLFFFNVLFAQQVEKRRYAVKVVGLKVGEILATKTTYPDSIRYALQSKVDVNFLVYKLKVDYRVLSVLNAEGLLNSEVKVVSNRGNYTTKTKKKGRLYDVSSLQHEGGEVKKQIGQPIYCTFASIYFDEPLQYKSVYAEYYADFIQLSKLKEHVYRGELDKNIDEYYYENGKMAKSVKKNPITDLVIEYMAEKQKKKP